MTRLCAAASASAAETAADAPPLVAGASLPGSNARTPATTAADGAGAFWPVAAASDAAAASRPASPAATA